MEIHFSKERMEQTLDAYTRWWNGTLDRPLTRIVIPDAYAVSKTAAAPLLSQANVDQMQWTPEQVIEAMNEDLAQQEFLGDAFPFINFNSFGPGVLAAMMDGGARLDNSSGRVWFMGDEDRELCDVHVRYNPENPWALRIKSLYRAGAERWGNSVVMGMPDLGGVLDVLASIRGSENLLMDLYDCPEEVIRLRGEIETAWYEAYRDMRSAMAENAYYSDWSGLLSREPSYIIQCDFCYMISNEMFREFVLDTLRRDIGRLKNVIYHLDGIGELNHLDDICSLPELKAVQWAFGAGQPGPMHWLDVYHKVMGSGKRVMIEGEPEDFLEVLEQLHGTPYFRHVIPGEKRELADSVINAR